MFDNFQSRAMVELFLNIEKEHSGSGVADPVASKSTPASLCHDLSIQLGEVGCCLAADASDIPLVSLNFGSSSFRRRALSSSSSSHHHHIMLFNLWSFNLVCNFLIHGILSSAYQKLPIRSMGIDGSWQLFLVVRHLLIHVN
ncbi:hypothetical protein Tco_0681627 [Tanacetum coccineum]|uniref:Uncharacterized protein n=1 Tax=Tanacetum coccineum TaxID=301880 RepID=A0ABQ4XNV5_9ASTR